MTSELSVWVWLPGAIELVVVGKLVAQEDRLLFVYGRSYRSRTDAIPLYLPELPLQSSPCPARAWLAVCVMPPLTPGAGG